MPPALSEDEASASETEIPYREVDTEGKKKQPSKFEEDDEEDDEDEEEYAVEKIMNHIYEDKDRQIKYEVVWVGFPKIEDRTYEPKENLMHNGVPIEELQEYWDKHCDGVEPKYVPKRERNQAGKDAKPGPGAKKRKLDQSAQSTPAGKETKGHRKSIRGQEISATPKEEAPISSKEKESDVLPPGSWEKQIATIDTIIQEPNAKTGTMDRFCYVSWTDGSRNRRTKHSLAILKQKCPQKLIEYFEQHLVFHTPRPSPEPNGDADSERILKSEVFMDVDE